MTFPVNARHFPIAPFSKRLSIYYSQRALAVCKIRLSSSSAPSMAQQYKLKDVTALALKPGERREVEIEGIPDGKVLLVNAVGKVYALGARCTHYGAPLVKGVLGSSGRLTCPWHGACFDTRTGDVEDSPALDSLPIFDLSERDGTFYITGDEDAIKSSRRKPTIPCKVSDSTEEKIVIVGGGSGGIGVIEGLRERGYVGAIVAISNEGYLPIDRPKLSKGLITDHGKVVLRDQSWFDAISVEWIEGEVVDVDTVNCHVAMKSGVKFPYTKLVLATGGYPRQLPLPGFGSLGNIFTLRTIHDTKKIAEALGDGGKKIVVIGSSFIGMEMAVATIKNNSVVVVGMEQVPLQRVLGEAVGAGIQSLLETKGVLFKMEAGVERAEPSAHDPSKVGAVHLKDGTRIEADLVVLGVGVSPATGYLKDNKAVRLEHDGSLKTDECFSVVGLDNVYAIGDIATYPYHGPGGDGKHVRIEHWNVAQNAGRAVAATIINPSLKSRQFLPVFWSALGVQLRYCGNTAASGWDGLVLQGSAADGKFVAYYAQGETVVAMASMGMDPVVAQGAELMKLGRMPSKTELQQGVDVFSLDSFTDL